MRRRPGLTLTEVLVTLAILSFGILGVLTMFPLAASQMAVAVREDRSAQAANAADAYMRSYWKSEIVEVIKSGVDPTEPFYVALDTPNAGATTSHGLLSTLLSGLMSTSHPVVVDPIGFAARTPSAKDWLGDGGASNVPRRSLRLLSNPQHAFRTCSLMDGMGYDDNGHPTPDRELRYNWMWVLQRPVFHDRTTANMAVVVFDNRPQMYAPVGSESILTNVSVVLPGSTSLDLSFSADLKPGSWIMEVTDPLLSIAIPPEVKIPQANFYQVVSATPSGPSVKLELNIPLKNDPMLLGVSIRKFVVLKGVTHVYERAPLTGN